MYKAHLEVSFSLSLYVHLDITADFVLFLGSVHLQPTTG
jgi:hypothetical protein